ncbi:unnamed protein product [Arabis nemorensis]|uniref:Alkaline/neutral invertase n=1 Tax=Arabis nemorensis TaxID=586526 RepID=A0A565B4L9_9BRAS|nr:unnamed protein product [Arabis nemorensis]
MRPSKCIRLAFTRISPSKYIRDTAFRSCPSRFLSCRNQNNNLPNPDTNGINNTTNAVPSSTDRQNSVAARVVSEASRSLSFSTTCTNGTTLDQIIAKNGFNVKPLTVERLKGDEKAKEVINGNDDKTASKDGFEGTKKNEVEEEAWRLLRESVVKYCDSPVGTMAANDPTDTAPLNYDQVFIRDFIPSGLAFLLKGESEIVRNFLLHTLQLQSWEKTVDCYSPGQGLMPASFKVRTLPLEEDKAYGKITGDYSLQERIDVQTGIKMIANLCLSDGFDMFPTLLVTDGSCMIDRRMGIHGHPLEIQALFYSALRSSREMLTVNDSSKNLMKTINNRLSALSFHIRENYWVDKSKINEIYRYKTEEYSMDATNKFNIYPEQVSPWLMDWIPEGPRSGFLVGNLTPGHMDFRFFTLGNLWSIISSLGTPRQNQAILNLIEERWDDIIGHMPLKICYPALESSEWHIITGSDPKNTPWSYHNGGSWPTLLWQFTLACIKMGKPELAEKAVTLAGERLQADRWPEYYDTRDGKFIGKKSRLYQTWTIAGFLTSKQLLQNHELASSLFWEEDLELLETCVCALTKSGRKKCSRAAAKSQILI